MASKETILRDEETSEVYSILVIPDEVKHLETGKLIYSRLLFRTYYCYKIFEVMNFFF